MYFVQSLSRDSHDGEKTTTSFHSSPVLSPTGSPPHSHSFVGRHSRESSNWFSGSLKPGSRKISPDDRSAGRHNRKGQKPWKECDVIEKEGLLEDEGSRKELIALRHFVWTQRPLFSLHCSFSHCSVSQTSKTFGGFDLKKKRK
ncbi:hypothetical protein F0562_013146 [Nyssa sinensis]|uniref:Uncharacterized protein n=1 Tax=Nyssa sinensis TaxID=561372 RepID=A0A5J4ZUJ7_9ASTE|nr:hypothetical protein F0562_013146 [Nyssa sinensis]